MLKRLNVEPDFDDNSMLQECISEMKVKDQKLYHNLLVTEKQPNLTQIMESQHYSSIQKLFGVTAYFLRFVNNLKNKIRNQPSDSPATVTARAISSAESLWIQEAQSQLVEDPNFAVWERQL